MRSPTTSSKAIVSPQPNEAVECQSASRALSAIAPQTNWHSTRSHEPHHLEYLNSATGVRTQSPKKPNTFTSSEELARTRDRQLLSVRAGQPRRVTAQQGPSG